MNYTVPPKKMLIINILDILKQYSDENHRLSTAQIGKLLETEYYQKADRKAIKRNLMNLIDFGYEIEYSQTPRVGKNGEEETILSDWYLNREFTDAELRLLMDGLLFSKSLPYNQCKELIEKLGSLSNKYFHARVGHIRNLPENLPENKQVFWTIDVLDEAISKRKQVAFEYVEYDLNKTAQPRKNKEGSKAEVYTVSPYQMAATNGRYYLICNRMGFSRVSNYRVDRIMNIRLLDVPAVPLKSLQGYQNGLDLPKHMAEHIYMFAGQSIPVTFLAKQYLIGDVLDWFGRDVRLRRADDDLVQVNVLVNEEAMFYWALQYGMHVEVKEPASLRMRLAEATRDMAEKYNR
ncbi:WYL domain-containing protein [Eubacteriales bacterium OttesenSCG-928-N14]|nr:WYL domain-containing protein [Eubacteriales bacterium OttesenSCG-928-N14]